MEIRRCRFLRLGIIEYGEAWRFQQKIFESRSNINTLDTVITLQHPPTFTVGKRGKDEHFLISIKPLISRGFALYRVNRGGGVTFHGPGQVVVYPILNIKLYTLDYYEYLRMLEETMIMTLSDYGIKAQRIDGRTGVWVGEKKIGSIGIRIVKGYTMHGFSLNINNDLTPFSFIVPCNTEGMEVTSMKNIKCFPVSVESVTDKLSINFAHVFGVELITGKFKN